MIAALPLQLAQGQDPTPPALILLVVAIFCTLMLLAFSGPLVTWVRALTAGSFVPFAHIVGMRLRGANPTVVVEAFIIARKGGARVELQELEAHHLAKGDVLRTVQAVVAAAKVGLDLPYGRAAAFDLAGKDPRAIVDSIVTPRTLRLPDVRAEARDGTPFRLEAQATVRGNLDRVVGGAGEETLVARLQEALVAEVGALDTADVREKGPEIAVRALERGIDAGTAYDVISVEVTGIRAETQPG